jgi:ATP-dependent Clp protease ATP-binding subunit ClpA
VNDSFAARILERMGLSLSDIRSEVENAVIRDEGKLGQEMQLTPRVKRVIDLAYDEARRLDNNHIGTEHLLLGLIREDDGLAARVLRKLGVDLERTRQEAASLQDIDIKSSEPTRQKGGNWQRFTERARRVVFYAQEEAGRLGENFITSEHLLLGLLRENNSIAARILERMGFSLDQIRSEVERQVTKGEGKFGQEMQLTPRAKRVIDLAYDEAKQLNNAYISTEHLLLGLIREGEGLAARILNKLGIGLERTRQEAANLQDTKGDDQLDQEMQLKPGAKHAIEFAYDEARKLNNNNIDTEHLLLGLIREGEGLASRILEKLGVDLESMRKEVAHLQDTDTTNQ